MKAEALNKLSRSIHKVGFKLKKHSPEILTGAGIVCVVASTVMACKATTKLSQVLEEAKEQADQIHGYVKKNGYSEKYSENDEKKDLAIVYTKSGMNIAKLYGPSVLVGVLGVTSILAGNNILKKRNVALTAAYTAVDNSFKKYRERVAERFGENIDRELKNNVIKKEVEVGEVDENGEVKKVKTTAYMVNPSDISEYARFFEEYTVDDRGNRIKNTYWTSNNEYNLMFLKKAESFANDKLRTHGYLFLNDVYEMLGIPKSKAGQVVGWVYDEKNPVGDNYVDFGLYKDNLSYSDFVNGYDPAILLDFNVDGNIWKLMDDNCDFRSKR
jgi:hypothetical protein